MEEAPHVTCFGESAEIDVHLHIGLRLELQWPDGGTIGTHVFLGRQEGDDKDNMGEGTS